MAVAASAVTHPQCIYLERVTRSLSSGMSWLDVGCGRRLVPDWLRERGIMRARIQATGCAPVGVDLELAALAENTAIRHRLVTSACFLPFRDGSFDLVTSN